MDTDEQYRYIPDHTVPLAISRLMNATNERIGFGTSEVVRVHVMGIIRRVTVNESDVVYELTDKTSNNNLMIMKIFTASFTAEQAQIIAIGDYVEVFGKVRVTDSEMFLNAFALLHVTPQQYAAFQSICRCAERFFEEKTAKIANAYSFTLSKKVGMKMKFAAMNRFPIGMLEESSSIVNNMGKWPKELEQLAAQLSADDLKEDQDVDGEDNYEEEDVDSFDAGPVQVTKLVPNEELMEFQDDSFDNK
ncbi:unnamed protein product [Caenorhabditis sp. 36 PRJEB53466]|nr:unnamed protein product [Caenorhabditis sp. 36 PRJEB53466]